MRVLIISGELIGSAICHKLLRDGHEIKLHIDKLGWKDCLEGIVPKTDNWRAELDWVGKDGLILFDDVGFGKEQDELRKKGYRVVGGTAKADKLELNRAYFHDVLKTHDVDVLPSIDFKNSQDAIDYIKQHPDQWVVKQNSHYGALNYVGELIDGSDAIGVLESYKEHGMSAHIQRRAHGIEIGIARYFNGNNWVGPIEINHEHKRMCNGDIGPLTPEMGTIMWFSDDDNLLLFEKTLKRLEPFLRKVEFKGDFDINCIVDENNIWPLEATARFGVPSTELHIEMMESPLIDFLEAIADGGDYNPEFSDGFGIAVSIAVPPFPYTKNAVDQSVFTTEVVQLFYRNDITDEDKIHIHPEEISRLPSEEGLGEKFCWAGTNGWTMHVTSHGNDIESIRGDVYKIIDKIILPKRFYRSDIGIRVQESDLPQLSKWGWI